MRKNWTKRPRWSIFFRILSRTEIVSKNFCSILNILLTNTKQYVYYVHINFTARFWKRLDDLKRHIRTLNSGTLFVLTAEHCGKFCIGLFKMQGGEPMKVDDPELIEEFLNIKERS